MVRVPNVLQVRGLRPSDVGRSASHSMRPVSGENIEGLGSCSPCSGLVARLAHWDSFESLVLDFHFPSWVVVYRFPHRYPSCGFVTSYMTAPATAAQVCLF